MDSPSTDVVWSVEGLRGRSMTGHVCLAVSGSCQYGNGLSSGPEFGLFQKFPEPFLCLVGISRYYTLDEETYPRFLHDDGTEMDLFAFIHAVDPTKVRIVERGRAEGEVKLLDSTVRHVVSLLPVNPAHTKSKLEASVDKLFDEGGSAKQG
ncbi:hypothetical protein Tco_0962733, partial [Tanacetum coccineum]